MPAHLRSMLHVDRLLQDLRYAARTLRRAPGFALLTIFTLAVVIGANVVVFSVINGVLLRPLTYPQSDRLVVVHDRVARLGRVPISASEYEEWTRSTTSFESMALFAHVPINLTGSGEAERFDAARVSPDLFSLLRVQPAVGRLFARGDDVPGRERVVVLANGLWRRRFGGDPAIIGQAITLNGRPYTVIGVLPDSFRFPRFDQVLAMPIANGRPELWVPFAIRPDDRMDSSFACIARLRPNVTLARAQTDVSAIQRTIGDRFTPRIDLDADVVSMRDQITGEAKQNLLFLWVGVLIVLAVATANIANLLTARATRRQREMAVRLAVGASRRRLVAQLVTEGLLLTTLGAAFGAALAYAIVPAVARLVPAKVPRLDEVVVDASSLAFAVAMAIVAGLIVGVLAGLKAARTSLVDAVRTHATAADVPRDRVTRRVLVAAQVTLTMVCVASSALLVESLSNVLRVDRGFSGDHVLTVNVAAAGVRYRDAAQRATLVREAVDRLRMLPGVDSVGVANKVPLSGVGMSSIMVAAGTENAAMSLQERPLGDIRSVNRDYFAALGIPLIRGRLFEDRDGDRDVAVVSVAAAARTWPGRDPIGQRFRLTADPQRTFDVIGIVGNVRANGLDLGAPLSVYLPYARGFMGNVAFAIQTQMPPAAMSQPVRAALHAIDPDLAVSQIQPMNDLVDAAVATRRFEAAVLGTFAAVAVLLAAVGVYAVLAFAVAQRTREIGVRVALGATPSRVRRMVVRDAAAMVATGIVIGVPTSLLAGFGLRSVLFGVTPLDPIAIVGAGLLLSLVALIAAYVPARRAASIDPMVSLRAE